MTDPSTATAARFVPPAVRPKTRLPPGDTEGRSRRARLEPMAVRPLRDGRYAVETDSGTYVVDLDDRTCTCPDHAIRGQRCKHLRRVAVEVTTDRLPAPDERTVICAVCGAPAYRPEAEDGAPLCDRHRPAPGDLVRDRETDSLLVVTAVTAERADERVVPGEGRTVADFETNDGYGDHEPVIEAVYLASLPATPTAADLRDRKRYAFPASRLVPVDREHPRLDPGRLLARDDAAETGAGAAETGANAEAGTDADADADGEADARAGTPARSAV